ncbi:MAG: hypothetical protein ACJA1S_000898 [Cellvibrionaceae bacterium]|jgi:hypothetical protein
MKKSQLIKEYLSKLSLYELLRYRLKLCTGEPNEDIELDISDLFKYPTRLETSYYDNWQKDLFKSLYLTLEGEFDTAQELNKRIEGLFSEKRFSEKDERTLTMFDNFLASLKSSNVTFIYSSLKRLS